ncbi:MAG: hypothetical protein ABR980_11965 [Ignavibacteriaceae bacterium]|jgi:hypothetical protein
MGKYDGILDKVNLKDLTVCVFDTGSFTPLAQRLTEEFGKVLYFSPWEGNGFPKSKFDKVGTGIKGVERIPSIWDYADSDEIDLYVFTDCYYRAEQEYLRRRGKLVWGSAGTSWLERNKMEFYKWVDKEEMPIPETSEEIGLEELAKNIKPDEFIKIPEYRGDLETLKYYDKERSEFRLKELELNLSPFDKTYHSIRQAKIDGVEIGGDSYTVDGQFPKKYLWGIEDKDRYYFGKIVPYESLPEQIQYVDEKLAGIFKKEKARTHFSHEMRIGKNKEPHFMDFTARFPNPPYQLHLEMTKNLGEIMYYGAQGEMIEPKYEDIYGVVAIFRSPTAEAFNLPIKVPDKVKKFVKVMNLAIVEEEYVAVNINKFDECGAVVGTGGTLWEARNKCEENAKDVKADGLVIDVPSKEDIENKLKELKQFGIQF